MSDPTRRFSLEELLSVVVQGSHQGILDRSVDAEWHKAFVQELLRRSEQSDVQGVVSGFIRVILESPEAQDRAMRLLADRLMEPLLAPVQALRPSPLSCISAGCVARAAGLLRRGRLRRWAGPFDWMTIPPAAVRDALADDFTVLTQARHIAPIPAEGRPVGSQGHLARHVRYSELHGETLFHGMDPSTPAGFAALERAALRLRDALRGLHTKVLFQLVEEDAATPALWAETAEALDRFSRGASLVTVALVPGEPEGPFPEMELADSRKGHRLLRCRTLSAPQATGYADLLDEVVILRGALATAAAPTG